MISQIANKYNGKISPRKIQKFKEWYNRYTASEQSEDTTGEPPSKSRRITYDPITEVPKLQWWFRANNGKTDDQKLHKYADELNQGTYREQRGKISASNIRTWFKNERRKTAVGNAENIADSHEPEEVSREGLIEVQ